MRISYSYKSYKYFPKLTRRSKVLGYFTGGPTFALYALIWVAVAFALLTSAGMSDNPAMLISFGSLVLLYFLLKYIRKIGSRKLDEKCLKEIQKLQSTDPQKYQQILSDIYQKKDQ
ncbi:MAG: hypothetical protein E7458_03115 [Ruminococcaceae bacterium]|nr:hypothetical protein [Oscillospiraceae bacterium]